MARVLVVDDEQGMRDSLRFYLEQGGHSVCTAETADRALVEMDKVEFDVVVTDIIMPRTSGVELLQTIRKYSPYTQVVLITGEPTVETAAAATRAGAFDYLPKPIKGESVCRVVTTAAQVKALEDENRRYRDHLEELVRERTAALEKSEQRLELAVWGADLGVWDWNIPTGEVIFNHRWAEMLGYSPEEIDPHVSSWEKLLHPEDQPGTMDELNAHLEGRTPVYETEHRLLTKSGDWKWILDRGKVVERDKQGHALRATGTHLDITERKQAEQRLQTEYASLKKTILSRDLEHPQAFSEIVTNSASMRFLFQLIETISRTDRQVLITGETGVGKELMAQALHVVSGRKGPLVVVNVAGLDDNAFSDTLFGHLKGAFTGADKNREGLIKRASGGTLFLDEIGDLSPASQVKLLRLLQEREYLPLGADSPRQTDARIVMATNRDLDALQKTEKFRQDLYFRLQTHRLNIPPLRERPDDLPLLVEHFLEKASAALEKNKPTYPGELFALLGSHHFPGNVRELETMIFDAVSHHKSRMLSLERFKLHIQKHHSPVTDQTRSPHGTASMFSQLEMLPTMKEVHKTLISEALKRSKGNQTVAAKLLGMSQPGLSKALKRDGLQQDET